jgi:hypothetical protein
MWADCLDNVGSLTSYNPIGLHGLLRGYLYFYFNSYPQPQLETLAKVPAIGYDHSLSILAYMQTLLTPYRLIYLWSATCKRMWLLRLPSYGVWRHVALVTGVSEALIASINRVKRISELGTTLTVTNNWRRRETKVMRLTKCYWISEETKAK